MARFKAITCCYCNECDAQPMPSEDHACGKDLDCRNALERPPANGASNVLGFTDKEFLFKWEARHAGVA